MELNKSNSIDINSNKNASHFNILDKYTNIKPN